MEHRTVLQVRQTVANIVRMTSQEHDGERSERPLPRSDMVSCIRTSADGRWCFPLWYLHLDRIQAVDFLISPLLRIYCLRELSRTAQKTRVGINVAQLQ